MQPAIACGCTDAAASLGCELGIPDRYAAATFENFWEWWKDRHPRSSVLLNLSKAVELLAHPVGRESLGSDITSKLDHIVHKCGAQGGDNNLETTWKTIRPAQEPSGILPFQAWAQKDRATTDLWWIDGPTGSGRSSLAAAALRAWCSRTGKPGLFVSVRAFSQELKDTYYDVRSFQNQGFQSERDRMAPLLNAPCLVLDDLDRLDTDIRVARAMAQLLDFRYAALRPTLITASRWAESLENDDGYALGRLNDSSLLRRLGQSHRVVLQSTLDRLLSHT
jgi:hypothetical protein